MLPVTVGGCLLHEQTTTGEDDGTPKVTNVFGRSGTGFSGWSKSKERLDGRMVEQLGKLAPWGLHDLRRTMSTRLHDVGVESLVVEALLAHKRQGIGAVYNRAKLRELKAAALKRWHELLREVVADVWDGNGAVPLSHGLLRIEQEQGAARRPHDTAGGQVAAVGDSR